MAIQVYLCPCGTTKVWQACSVSHNGVMTTSVSTLLTGRYGCNWLYLNWLGDQPLAKRSFWKVVLTGSCRGFNLAIRSISVTYCKSVTNSACQEGRKSGLSLIGFRKFICACPCHMSMHVCLWRYPVAGPRFWNDVFPCWTAVWGLRTGVAVRGFTRRGPPRSGGKDSPEGAYLYAGPGREHNILPNVSRFD